MVHPLRGELWRCEPPQLERRPVVEGFPGADLVRRDLDGSIEFTVISRWASMNAVRDFAGDDPEQAVVEPGAVAALRDFEARVVHYEVVDHVVNVS